MTRVAGTAELSGLDDEQRDSAIKTLFVELARLHRLAPDDLDTGFRRLANAGENALCDLDLWQTIFENDGRKALLTRWLFGWLRATPLTTSTKRSRATMTADPGTSCTKTES